MEEVQTFLELLSEHWVTVIVCIVAIIVAIYMIRKFYVDFKGLFGIETSRERKDNERDEKIQEVDDRVTKIEDRQEKFYQESNEADEMIETQISDMNVLLKSLTIASMRSDLWRMYKQFTDAGYVTQEGLTTFLDCGRVYEAAGGNDIYHNKIYPEVMALPVHDN